MTLLFTYSILLYATSYFSTPQDSEHIYANLPSFSNTLTWEAINNHRLKKKYWLGFKYSYSQSWKSFKYIQKENSRWTGKKIHSSCSLPVILTMRKLKNPHRVQPINVSALSTLPLSGEKTDCSLTPLWISVSKVFRKGKYWTFLVPLSSS